MYKEVLCEIDMTAIATSCNRIFLMKNVLWQRHRYSCTTENNQHCFFFSFHSDVQGCYSHIWWVYLQEAHIATSQLYMYIYAKCTKTIISGRSITISLSWFCYLYPHYFNIPAPMQVFRERLFPQEHTTHLQQRGTCLQNPSHRQKQKAQHVNFGKLMGGRKRVAKTPARCTRTAMPRHATSVSLFILSPLVCLCLQTIRGTLVYAGRWGELNICSQCQRQT